MVLKNDTGNYPVYLYFKEKYNAIPTVDNEIHIRFPEKTGSCKSIRCSNCPLVPKNLAINCKDYESYIKLFPEIEGLYPEFFI